MRDQPRWVVWLVVVMALSAATKYLLGVPDPGWNSASEKVFPVLAMAALLASSRPGRPGWLVVAGLLASAVGDIMLDLGVSTFLPGVAAFALAHLLYIVAFTLGDRRLRPLTAVPFFLWGALVLWRIVPGMGPETAPVVAYIVIITAMMWRSAAQAMDKGRPGAWLGLLGAVLFGASDTLIALRRWGSIDSPGWLVMVLYWAGQSAIAAWGLWSAQACRQGDGCTAGCHTARREAGRKWSEALRAGWSPQGFALLAAYFSELCSTAEGKARLAPTSVVATPPLPARPAAGRGSRVRGWRLPIRGR